MDDRVAELLQAIQDRIAAGLSAIITIQMVLGVEEGDAKEVQAWVADDPHDHEPDNVLALRNEIDRLRAFETALYSRMTMERIAW